ncbi:MAG TPA: MlaD family protein [Solirubrobacteraceae bacterium]
MNRRKGTLAGNPLLIGAVTTLIVIVAVYISYNANNGLPFAPTYKISVELPNAANLEKGNEVRIGGTRVGIVEKLVPQQKANGTDVAIAVLKLEKNIAPLPANTKAIVQLVSSIGLKFLQLERGNSRKTIPEGGTIPVSQTREPVNIDELFDMFNKKTRNANQINLTSFGSGFAGRGLGLNETLKELLPLVNNLTPVMRTLASPKTALGPFWEALDRAAKETAPVAEGNGRFFKDIDTFFSAWAGVSPEVEESIQRGSSALKTAIYSLPYEAPFVRKSTEFMRLLRPSAKLLRSAAPPLAEAFHAGAVNFKRAKSLNNVIASSAEATQSFAESPIVTLALEDFTRTAKLGNPVLESLALEQTKCNYITLLFRNVSSIFSESIGVGTLARVSAVLPPEGPGNEGYPASGLANGPSTERAQSGQLFDSNHVHYNPYPNAGSGSTPICEAGNEQYEATTGVAEIGHTEVSGTEAEETHRSENLFGRTYPEATLKDLGLKGTSTGKGKSTGKGTSTGKGKGKGASTGKGKGKSKSTGGGK